MAYHNFRLLIDWSGNGQFNINATSRENVSADVIGGIRAAAGIDYGQVFPQAKAGRASFTLRNDHGRYSGYNDDNDLGSGLIQGVLLQIWCGSNRAFGGTGAWLPIWGGIVDSVRYDTSPSGLDTAEVACIGNLGAIQDADVDVSVTDTSIAAIGTDIARQIWPSTRIQDTGNATFRYIMRSGNPLFRYYLETSNAPTFGRYVYEGRALKGLRGLAADTGSRLFEGAEGAVRLYSEAAQTSLAAGAARFTLRHTTTGTNASTFHVSAARPELAQGNIINSVTVNYPIEDIEVITNPRAYGALQYWYDEEHDVALPYPPDGRDTYWTYANTTDNYVSSPSTTFESISHITRADPRQPSTLQSVQTFVIERLVVWGFVRRNASDPFEDGGWSGTGAQTLHIFVVPPGTTLTVGETLTLTQADSVDTVDWVADAWRSEAADMTLKLTMNAVAGNPTRFLLSGELHNLHPAIATSRNYRGGPRFGGPRIYVGSWTVSHGFIPTSTTVTDAASISKYGTKSYTPSVSFVATETEARTFARSIINREREAKTRYRVTYLLDQKGSLTDIPQVSDIVNVEYRGTTTKCWVDSVRHNITKRNHTCEMLLTPV